MTKRAGITLAVIIAVLVIAMFRIVAPSHQVEVHEGSAASSAVVDSDFGAGEKLFNNYCAACHRRGGQGDEGRVPPLDDSPWVSGSEERLIRIVLNGLHGPIVMKGITYNLEMPGFRQSFKDSDIAATLSYVRRRYGNASPPIDEATVARVRQQTRNRQSYWTVEDLQNIP